MGIGDWGLGPIPNPPFPIPNPQSPSCTTTLKMKSLIKKTNNKLINNSQDDNSSIHNVNKLESPEDIYFLIV